MKMKKLFTREVKIGLMALVSILILYFGINYLKGVNIFKPTNYYYATYDNIDGLVETNPVMIRGCQVGMVREIKRDFSKQKPFVVVLYIDKGLKLPKGTKADLFDNGLMGGKAVRLIFDPAATTYQEAGDTLVSTVSVGLMGQLSADLMPKINSLITETDSLIVSVRAVVQSPELKKSLASIEKTTAELEQSSTELKKIMKKDLPKVITDVNIITSNLSIVSNNIKKIDFASTMASVDNTIANLNEVTRKMNSKEGSLGLLINDTRLYDNLNDISQNANILVVDLKQNPKRYVHFSVFAPKDKK